MSHGEQINHNENPIDRLQGVGELLVGLQSEIDRQLTVLKHVPFDDRVIQDLDQIRSVSDHVRTVATSIFETAGDVKTELVEKHSSDSKDSEQTEILELADLDSDIPAPETDKTDILKDYTPETRLIRIRRALRFLDKRESTSKVFHARIVKKGFGHSLERVTSDQYEDFLDDLDQLVESGYLESNINGSTYRLKAGIDVNSIPLEDVFIEDSLTDSDSSSEASTPALSELDEDPIVLSGLEQSVLMLLVNDDGLRMQDIREQLPQFKSLDTKSSEWLEFKDDFAATREKIVEYMRQHHYMAHFTTAGKTRGTRYSLQLTDKRIV
jgi:hypothetical protein